MKVTVGILLLACAASQVAGHGMLWDPPNRSSMWRFGFPVPPNYEDNQNYCGGAGPQWNLNGGKCGICGDNYADGMPRANENGGKFGLGIIGKTYTSGSNINIVVRLTTAHKGDFTFGLCNMDTNRESEDCYKTVYLTNGADKFTGADFTQDYTIGLKLPQGVKCKQCVLRWHYRTANNYGQCDDGSWATGCGPQETFRSCSDITIA